MKFKSCCNVALVALSMAMGAALTLTVQSTAPIVGSAFGADNAGLKPPQAWRVDDYDAGSSAGV